MYKVGRVGCAPFLVLGGLLCVGRDFPALVGFDGGEGFGGANASRTATKEVAISTLIWRVQKALR